MAKNKLSDLNDHLFTALERLNDEDITGEQIEKEAQRATAIIGVSAQIIQNAKLTLDALKLVGNGANRLSELPETFGLNQLNK